MTTYAHPAYAAAPQTYPFQPPNRNYFPAEQQPLQTHYLPERSFTAARPSMPYQQSSSYTQAHAQQPYYPPPNPTAPGAAAPYNPAEPYTAPAPRSPYDLRRSQSGPGAGYPGSSAPEVRRSSDYETRRSSSRKHSKSKEDARPTMGDTLFLLWDFVKGRRD